MPPTTIKLLDVILPSSRLERLASGFWFLEGPVWNESTQTLIFHDIPGNIRRTWREEEGVRFLHAPTRHANGAALDQEGRLLVCEHGSRRVVRFEEDGSSTVLASAYRGVELNSPNDVVVGSDGDIWFTDPPYGRSELHGVPGDQQLPFQGVYRLPGPDARSDDLELVIDDMYRPNGLAFAREPGVLYVNDSERMHIRRFMVNGDGAVTGGEVWFDQAESFDAAAGCPDGMKVDHLGNVWVTGPRGVWVVSPQARKIGEIACPEVVGNLAFGGVDGSALFFCATTSLYRIVTSVRAL